MSRVFQSNTLNLLSLEDLLSYYIKALTTLSDRSKSRLFSAMKRIKTAQRNRLKTDTLVHLIRVSTEGPSISEWNPISAMKIWQSKGPRRISTFCN